MADEEIPTGMDDDDDVSWEDAFAEAAAGHGNEPVMEAQDSAGAEGAGPAAGGFGAAMSQAQAGAPPASPDQAPGSVDIDFLLDLPLNVTVEVGRRKMMINELLQLGQSSIIPLEKEVGEPFEIYVNGKLMAYGEVVTVNEKFGIRLTDVIDPKERIQQLG